MREIIFRGKCVLSGEWIEGDLLTKGTDYEVAIKESVGGMGVVRRVDPATVGQFTGLLDKNGKRIFEGDVVALRTGRAHIVKFEDGSFILTGTAIPIRYVNKFGIIGNIHDNPELMEVTPDE